MSKQHPHEASDYRDYSYEQCREELERIVGLLEQGGQDLDTSVRLWEKGEQLAQRAYEYLQGAQTRINQVLHTQEVSVGDSSDASDEPTGSE